MKVSPALPTISKKTMSGLPSRFSAGENTVPAAWLVLKTPT